MNKDSIVAIRVLPNDKRTFKTEKDFKFFIEKTIIKRGGYYHFPSSMMKCEPNTLILFQYDGMVRAIGILVSSKKTPVVDEQGFVSAGYYKFDTSTLKYLDFPIDKTTMKSVYPSFSGFNQSKQIIPLDCLDKLFAVIKSSLNLNNEDEVLIEAIEKDLETIECEGVVREAIVKCRVNQDVFREKLLDKYSHCCICGVNNPKLLIASHIKPWSCSGPTEKLDIENGFLMCPNHDKLFDNGFISFDDNGRVIISQQLNETDRVLLNIHSDITIKLTEKNKEYLKYHREYIFKK